MRFAGLAALVIVLIAAPSLLPTYYLDVAARILELAIFAMSLDLLLGYTGLWSLGHAAFFGIAAYGVGLFSLRIGPNPLMAIVASLVATLVIAALFGAVILRSRGVYFMMLSLGLAQVVWGIAFEWRSLTHGDDGLPGITRPDLTLVGVNTSTAGGFYVVVAIAFVIATGLMFLITRSLFGQTLKGIRENELRMKTLGYNVWLHQYVAYLLAAFFAGWAGILYAYHNGIVSPNDLSVLRSAEALLMVVLGSPGTLFGAVLGSAVVVLLRNVASVYTERWLTILGVVYVLTVLFASGGLYATARQRLQGFRALPGGGVPGRARGR